MFDGVYDLLQTVYNEMIELCEPMIRIGSGIAGLGALLYVSYRVWSSIARAEAIDVFSLLRPFVLGLCILFFPSVVLGTINGVLQPVVDSTKELVEVQREDIADKIATRENLQKEVDKKNGKEWLYNDAAYENELRAAGVSVSKRISLWAERQIYKAKIKLLKIVHEILKFIYDVVGFCIDLLRTFILIILSILGPIVFGIAVWDGLGSSLTSWLSRYISIYLWLPVKYILDATLSKIESSMIQLDINSLQAMKNGAEKVSSLGTSLMYITFFAIGIICFMCVPTISSWIVEAGGGAGAVGRGANKAGSRLARGAGKVVAASAGFGVGNVVGRLKKGVEGRSMNSDSLGSSSGGHLRK